MESTRPRRCFCLSKARDGGPAHSANAAALRRELEELRPSALSKRAREAGAASEDVEEALDAADPKSALIELIVAHCPPAAAADEHAAVPDRMGMEQLRLGAGASSFFFCAVLVAVMSHLSVCLFCQCDGRYGFAQADMEIRRGS